MKRYPSLILICMLGAVGVLAQHDSPIQSLVHVATALNHLTVLEFHEPVTMAAAGSSDFQIERQADKVFIKPMKAGVATDLFVWTASRRFTYELETTPEAKNMNFAIDSFVPRVAQQPVSVITDQFADLMLARAFLDAVDITRGNTTPPKNQVSVRVEQVFRTKSSIYIHYKIENGSKRAFHIALLEALELQPEHSAISLPGLVHKQLDQRVLASFRDTRSAPLPIVGAESVVQELGPGEATQGVVSIRQNLSSPTVVQLAFDGGVKATFVL
ncbi:MAG: TrbG/VirB9 family P-type conjugative transfer protein [Terriglobales bacterium]